MKTQYYTAATLDGFIADEDNSLDWLFQLGGDPEGAGDTGFSDFIREVGALAMGSTTYQWMLDNEVRPKDRAARPWPYTQPTWVFSSREQPRVEGADLRFAPVWVATSPGAYRQWSGGHHGGVEDPILSLRGLGRELWRDETADEYVTRLRRW